MAAVSKTERKFNNKLRRLLRQPGLNPQWQVTTIDGYQRPWATWDSIKHGSHDVAAVAPVTINGRPYWAVARMVVDLEKFLGPLVLFGLLGGAIASLFNRPKVDLALWREDPRELEQGRSWYNDATRDLYTWASRVNPTKL